MLKNVSDSTCFFAFNPIEAVEGKQVKLDKLSKVKCLVKYEDDDGELWLSANVGFSKEQENAGDKQKTSLKIL